MTANPGAVVVTGASGGIGRAVCERLAEEGHAVIAQYRSNHAAALALEARLSASGAHCALVRADLHEPESVDLIAERVAETASAGWRLRGLVNNAAKLLSPSFSETTPNDFDEYFTINVKAPLFLTQRLVPMMKNGGSVVNVSSANAHFSSPGDLVYAMSKAALESLTINMAEDVARAGVRVNYVIPGFTDNGHAAFRVSEVREYMSSFAALGGIADPAVVAEAVLFLISDRSCRTTGVGLDVSGGMTIGARGQRAGSVRTLISG